jgi:hypothetical protein
MFLSTIEVGLEHLQELACNFLLKSRFLGQPKKSHGVKTCPPPTDSLFFPEKWILKKLNLAHDQACFAGLFWFNCPAIFV